MGIVKNKVEEKIPAIVVNDDYGVIAGDMIATKLSSQDKSDISTPHRHQGYTFFLLNTGIIEFIIDFEPVALLPFSILLIRPGQIYQAIPDIKVTGRMIHFEETYLDIPSKIAIQQYLGNTIIANLSGTEFQQLSELSSMITDGVKKSFSNQSDRYFTQSILNGLIHKSTGYFYKQELDSEKVYLSRSVEITRMFHQLIKDNYYQFKRPADYANMMNVTVSYLNDTLKAVSGHSCTYLIQQEIIWEAKRLLYYTSQNIKEIAVSLGYEDYKYFIRLFKKVAKSTPSNFRKKHIYRVIPDIPAG